MLKTKNYAQAVAILAMAVAIGAIVAGTTPAALAHQGYRERVIMEIPYGRGVNGIQVVPYAEEQLGFGADSWGVDAKGNVYIYDVADGWKIKKFSPRKKGRPKGQVLYEVPPTERPAYMTCDRLGNVYLYYSSPRFGGGVVKIDTTGQVCYKVRLGSAGRRTQPLRPAEDRSRQPLIQLFQGGSDEPQWAVGYAGLFPSAPRGEEAAANFSSSFVPTGQEMTVDAEGNLLVSLTWSALFRGALERGTPGPWGQRQVCVKITATGAFGGVVPSQYVDGKPQYYDFAPVWARRLEAKTYEIPVLDSSARKARSQALRVPRDIVEGTAKEAQIGNTGLFVDDAGHIYVSGTNFCAEERMSKCGLDVADYAALFVFSPSGNLVGKIDMPACGRTKQAFIDREGKVYFLRYEDLVVEVVECKRVSD